MNPMKHTPLYILAAAIILSTIGFLGAMLKLEIPIANKDMVTMASGALLAAFGTVVGYFFGSSKGSSDKNELLSKSTNTIEDTSTIKIVSATGQSPITTESQTTVIKTEETKP